MAKPKLEAECKEAWKSRLGTLFWRGGADEVGNYSYVVMMIKRYSWVTMKMTDAYPGDLTW